MRLRAKHRVSSCRRVSSGQIRPSPQSSRGLRISCNCEAPITQPTQQLALSPHQNPMVQAQKLRLILELALQFGTVQGARDLSSRKLFAALFIWSAGTRTPLKGPPSSCALCQIPSISRLRAIIAWRNGSGCGSSWPVILPVILPVIRAVLIAFPDDGTLLIFHLVVLVAQT